MMNWEAVGAIGELAGAGGVIVSLLYLAMQIRRQNVESRFAAVHELVSQTNAFFGAAAENNEVATIWVKGIENFEALDQIEKSRFLGDLSRTFRSTEGLLYLKLRGRLDPLMWVGIDRCPRDLCDGVGVKVFLSMRSHWYSYELNAYIKPYIDSESKDYVFLESYGKKT